MAAAASATDAFSRTLGTFCAELRATFPELSRYIDRAATLTAEQFWTTWRSYLDILVTCDFDRLVSERRGLLIGVVALTPALWSEISAGTQKAIWRYMRTLLLESAMSLKLDTLTVEQTEALMTILSEERLEAGGAEAEAEMKDIQESAMEHLSPLLDRLKGMMSGFMDASGGAAAGGAGAAAAPEIPMPEIPERLRNGCIAKLAEKMAKEFNPAEFGIDPELLKGDDVGEILKRLAELYQRDPTLLIGGAKRMAERIKRQIMGGSLNRDQLVAEAQEYVALFKEHPLFKEAIDKFQAFTGEGGLASLFGGGGGGSAPSERLRAVQERLRRKMEARRGGGGGAAASGGGGGGAASGGASGGAGASTSRADSRSDSAAAPKKKKK
jgi:hypothetical protein